MKSVTKGVLLFLAGMLLGVALTHKARGAEEPWHTIVGLKQGIKEALKGDAVWKVCGNYFAVAETTKGRMVHFTFEEKSLSETSTVFAFAPVDRITVSLNESVASPTVIVLGNERNSQFVLRMKMEDYRAGLPCLAKGTRV